MSTAQPTASPTQESNQTAYYVIILGYTIFMLFLLSCGATVYKSNNRREKFKLRLQVLREQYNEVDEKLRNASTKTSTVAEVEAWGKKKEKIKEETENLYTRDFYADLGDHFIAPITESGVSRTMNKLLFHTSIGRVLVNIEAKLEQSILAVFQYMLSLQGMEVFKYYAAQSLFPQQAILAQFFGLMIGYVLFLLLNLMKEEFVRSRMGGDMSVYEKQD